MSVNRYFTLGNSGLRMSRLTLGAMTFGTDWGFGADKETARGLFDAYLDAGGNVVDTADMYTNGTSEQWVGEFVRDRGARDQVVIATKASFSADQANPNAGGNGRKNILRALEGSLRRLGTDYIDLYILHAWDTVTPAEEVMRTFDDLVRAGKVRHVGLSNVPAWYASRAQAIAQNNGYEPVAAMQLEYSLAERSIENEFIPLGTRQGMGTMVWSPLASGLLSGKYKPAKDGKFGEGRLQTMSGTNNPAFAKFTDRNFRIVSELQAVALALDRSMAQVAVNWVANRPGVATVLIGATRLSQLDDNLKALDFTIPDELLTRLDTASQSEMTYPYTFFQPVMQTTVTGAGALSDKPPSYSRPNRSEPVVTQ